MHYYKELYIEHTLRSEFLQTGVEHWQTTYKSSIVDPYANTKAGRADWTYNKPPYTVDGYIH